MIPHDEAAERAVIGVVLNTKYGVSHVDALLGPSSFYLPKYGALYAAAQAMTDVTPLDDRIAYAGAFSDVPEPALRALVAESPVQFDASPWARRVAECAQRRAAMHRCVEAYEALRDGADIDEAMAWS